jgi:hypothetical protein
MEVESRHNRELIVTQPDQQQLQRLRYLQEMGIDSWYPRAQLPAAAESAVIEWQFGLPADQGHNPAAISAVAGAYAPADNRRIDAAGKAASVRQALSAEAGPVKDTGQQTRARPAVNANAPARVSGDDGSPREIAVLHFRMHLFHVDQQLAILCHQPALAAAQISGQEQILLANIVRWLGRELPDTQMPRAFRWPIPGFDQADTTVAGSSLFAFLQQAASEKPFANLVIMGETILDTLQVRLAREDSAWALFVTASLTEMLNLPALKKETWQTLIPLHSMLSGQV